jgi:hypothetical protein
MEGKILGSSGGRLDSTRLFLFSYSQISVAIPNRKLRILGETRIRGAQQAPNERRPRSPRGFGMNAGCAESGDVIARHHLLLQRLVLWRDA